MYAYVQRAGLRAAGCHWQWQQALSSTRGGVFCAAFKAATHARMTIVTMMMMMMMMMMMLGALRTAQCVAAHTRGGGCKHYTTERT
jgi:hypothetical protein